MLSTLMQSARELSITRVLSLCAILAVATPAASAAITSQSTLAKDGSGPFAHYRIVALANLGNGILLASYDGRPDGGDSPSPNSIMQRRSTDGGKTWGQPTYVAKGQAKSSSAEQYGFSDPSYVVDSKTGKVFNFHVFSKNQGFLGSKVGNDDTDRDIVSAEVSVSTDKGVSWSTDPENQPKLPPVASSQAGAPPLITKGIKPVGSTVNGVKNVGGIAGLFASSGQGIQLKYGAHAGRLVQQFLGRVVQPSGNVISQAYSVYSDDGGATWKKGNVVGTGMDENKVVELSNGNLMLNSRPSDGSGYRKVAISTDGGVNWSTPKTETQLPDPGNNGSIARAYPDAKQGSADAKILLFTNANSKSSRSNGTIRYSCDDGKTWSSGSVFQKSTTSYSTVTPLGGDRFGIFYEGAGNELIYLEVSKEFIGINC
ncbi:Neuraminidase [Penicillium cf. griseofulvum]|uniref:Neuraminidase n=1 Tax=Penicillium cf. griseofulvum TaxID=2972120 RepID=A0A9W9MS49_9EURO|nr:Neuraminidase [Penicillium cf. griseofulvum]KAJ5440471.1 Neuraminidase [Penicillium cf. griseofulvum]KAJ5448518.1 Neuraminidase [Penicillium cf. griseofulvum]